MHDDYLQFLLQKIPMATFDGYEIDDSDIHALLKPHQRACVKWAVKGGNRALFESFGLGKSLQHVYDYEHHVKIGEDLDFRGALPSSFMSMAPGSHRDDCWHDINRMLTLNTAQQKARAMMHVCPLQFDIVDRLINRYSNPGEWVYDPFCGLGTVPYRAIKAGRKGRGSELNTEYFLDSVKYLQAMEREQSMPDLFAFEDAA